MKLVDLCMAFPHSFSVIEDEVRPFQLATMSFNDTSFLQLFKG
jgi:hypothetical protein